MSKNEPNLKVKYNGVKKEIFDEFGYKICYADSKN